MHYLSWLLSSQSCFKWVSHLFHPSPGTPLKPRNSPFPFSFPEPGRAEERVTAHISPCPEGRQQSPARDFPAWNSATTHSPGGKEEHLRSHPQTTPLQPWLCDQKPTEMFNLFKPVGLSKERPHTHAMPSGASGARPFVHNLSKCTQTSNPVTHLFSQPPYHLLSLMLMFQLQALTACLLSSRCDLYKTAHCRYWCPCLSLWPVLPIQRY